VDDQKSTGVALNRHYRQQLTVLVRAEDTSRGSLSCETFGAVSLKITLVVSTT
jgi:hypothetical protein